MSAPSSRDIRSRRASSTWARAARRRSESALGERLVSASTAVTSDARAVRHCLARSCRSWLDATTASCRSSSSTTSSLGRPACHSPAASAVLGEARTRGSRSSSAQVSSLRTSSKRRSISLLALRLRDHKTPATTRPATTASSTSSHHKPPPDHRIQTARTSASSWAKLPVSSLQAARLTLTQSPSQSPSPSPCAEERSAEQSAAEATRSTAERCDPARSPSLIRIPPAAPGPPVAPSRIVVHPLSLNLNLLFAVPLSAPS